MTDEEKKAIEIVKGLAVYYDDYGLLDEEEIEENEEVNNSINIVINLIEKQSKEIEELKEQCKEVICVPEGTCFMIKSKDTDKKWEDKIKAKIEYYEKIDNPVGKRVLQSLLEKEGE